MAGSIYVTLHEFEAQEEDELDLAPGDKVRILKDLDEEWFLVSLFLCPVPSCVVDRDSFVVRTGPTPQRR